MATCPKCKSTIPNDAHGCRYCGATLTTELDVSLFGRILGSIVGMVMGLFALPVIVALFFGDVSSKYNSPLMILGAIIGAIIGFCFGFYYKTYSD